MKQNTLVRYNGDVTGQTPGWRFLKTVKGALVEAPFEDGWASNGGRIQSPLIKLDKEHGRPAYYRLKFKARATDHCYWWVDFFDAGSEPLPDVNSAVYPNSDSEDYDQMFYVHGAAQNMALAFQYKGGISVRDIVVRKVSEKQAARWNDALYAELPPLVFEPPSDAFARLPKTAAALRNGTPWRVVMLGDSIMNDSYNSVFQALVKRDFPRSSMDYIISVRGATGCWFYQEPEHFAAYVTRHAPNLLMIGGISNLNKDTANIPEGIAKIERVINQAQRLGCEIVLLSPPHAADWRPYDPRHPARALPVMEWDEQKVDAQGSRILTWSPYQIIAERCGVAFWNMTVPTTDYVAQSRKPHDFFNRDQVHNNDRGKQIIGQVLRRYFRTARNLYPLARITTQVPTTTSTRRPRQFNRK